jgi:hypothetical protein
MEPSALCLHPVSGGVEKPGVVSMAKRDKERLSSVLNGSGYEKDGFGRCDG